MGTDCGLLRRFADAPRSTRLPNARLSALVSQAKRSSATVFDHPRTLPQGDGGARQALTGRAVGSERNIVFDAGDVLDDALAVRRLHIDAEGEVSSRRGHLRPLLLQAASARFKERPRLPKRTGLELDRVRHLQSPVSRGKVLGYEPATRFTTRSPGRRRPITEGAVAHGTGRIEVAEHRCR